MTALSIPRDITRQHQTLITLGKNPLGEITSFLDDSSFGALRETCSALRALSFTQFTSSYTNFITVKKFASLQPNLAEKRRNSEADIKERNAPLSITDEILKNCHRLKELDLIESRFGHNGSWDSASEREFEELFSVPNRFPKLSKLSLCIDSTTPSAMIGQACPNLLSLEVHSVDYQNAEGAANALYILLKECPRLRHVKFKGFIINEKIMTLMKAMPFVNVEIIGPPFKSFCEVQILKDFAAIPVQSFSMGNSSKENLIGLPQLPLLRRVCLLDGGRADGVDYDFLSAQAQTIEHVVIFNHAELHISDLKPLSKLLSVRTLQFFDSNENDTLLKMCSKLPLLEEIHIVRNNNCFKRAVNTLTQKGIKYISRCRQLKKLQLYVGSCKITDRDLERLKNIKTITHLAVGTGLFTTKGMVDFITTPPPRLAFLDLSQAHQMDSDQVQQHISLSGRKIQILGSKINKLYRKLLTVEAAFRAGDEAAHKLFNELDKKTRNAIQKETDQIVSSEKPKTSFFDSFSFKKKPPEYFVKTANAIQLYTLALQDKYQPKVDI